MTAPTAFISYSHDSEPHKEWVKQLASDLRAKGIDAIIDQWDLSPGQDIAAFMERSLTSTDRVLLICTERYVEKANRGDGGVGYERLVVSAELVNRIDTKKFIPIVRQAVSPRVTPAYLGARLYIDFSVDSDYAQRLEELVREIHGVRGSSKPPLGPNPYTSVVPPALEPARMAGPSGLTPTGRDILGDPWFESHASKARVALERHGRTGAMEVRLALHDPIRKSQLELLSAVRDSQIRTFGWPLALTIENREEFRPRPIADGIQAEIALPEKGSSVGRSYDYWVARTTGDFYTIQSLFEDERTENALFFNTRIVRIAEVFLFAANLYEKLGASSEGRLSIRIGHRGLAGRMLRSSSPNRYIHPSRSAATNDSETQLVDSIGDIRKNVVDHVIQVAEPMFMLFDFAEFERNVYEEIVRSYEQGRVT